MTSTKRGTTLLETLISTAIFSLLALAVFTFFDIGRIQWSWMNLGRKLGTDARTAMASLERDLRRTNYSSVDIYSNPTATPSGWTTPVPRWAICFVGEGDPLATNNFDPLTGEPVWKKYIIYMATTRTSRVSEEALGGAGSGLFLKIAAEFNTSPTKRLPLHNPTFTSLVNWTNNNEIGRVKNNAVPSQAEFAGMYSAFDPQNPTFTSIPTSYSPSQAPNDFYNTVNGALNLAAAETALSTLIQNSPGFAALGIPLKSVHISVIANVFAVLFNKNDAAHTVGITFKTKGYTDQKPQSVNGYSSRQIDLVVATEYWNAK